MGQSVFPFLGASDQVNETHLTVYSSPECNPDWKLEWTSLCFINDPIINYGINVLWMNGNLEQIEYIKNRVGKEDGNGNISYTYQSMNRVFSMKVVVDDLYYDALTKAELFTDIKLYNLRTGGVYEIIKFEIKAEDDKENYDYISTLTFQLKAATVETTACECGAYADAPFENDCEDGGLEPRGTDEVCLGFDATITVDGNVLTATPSGGPANPTTYKWYYNPGTGAYTLLSSSAQTVTMGGYGTYRVIVAKGSCQVQKDHLNQDPCNGLIVRITKSNTALTAEVSGCESPTFIWSYLITGGGETPVGSTQSIVAEQTGNYKVRVTCGTCSREAMIYVEVTNQPACAGIANTISQSGHILTSNVSGCTGTLAITWQKDAGDGSGLQPLSTTGPSINDTGSGLYVATATCGTCIVKAEYLIIDCNIPCNVTISINRNGNLLSATHSGCIGAYTINWFKNNGSGYGSPIGMGDTYPISGNGMYRAEITCGTDCLKAAEFFVSDCNECNLSVSLNVVDDQITATPTGCSSGSPVYAWSIDTGQGYAALGATTATITATTTGIYKVILTCGTCTAENGVLYNGNCTPINPGMDASVNVCA